MSMIITVFGATGQQGGSVVKHILDHNELSKTYKIRAVTRDVSKPAAVALTKQGVEVISADLSNKEAVEKVVKGSRVVFGVTNFWETTDEKIEISQGKNIVDAAKSASVDRLIFSSLVNVTKETNSRITTVRHFDGKAAIEAYAREIGVPGTYFMPALFDSFFLDFFRKNEQGVYTLNLPFDENVKIPMIDIGADAGLFVSAILLKLPQTVNKRITASGGYITPEQAVRSFSEATGQKAVFNNIGWERWSSSIPPAYRDETVGNWQLIQNPGYYAGEPADSVDQALNLVASAGLRKPVSWKDFVARNFKA